MDVVKFGQLQDAFIAQQKSFQETLYKVKIEQTEQIKQMVQSFLIEKEKNRVEIIQLEVQQKDIKSKAIVMRNKVEEDSWARIDMLVEQNKTKLDVSIEQSMVAKGDLTKILKGFREFKQEKEQKQREIDEKNQDYVEQVQTLQQLKAETLVNAQEIKDRDVTLADKWVII